MPVALILAIAASLGLHVAVLFGPEFDLAAPADPPLLQATMQPLPTVHVATDEAEQPPKKKRRRRQPPAPVADVAEDGATPVLTAPDAAGAVPAPGAPRAQSPDDAPAPPVPADEVAAPEPPAPPPHLPEAGEILYRVDRGDAGFEIGRASSTWEIADGAYVLRLQTETTGLVWLFKPYRIDMESRGALEPGGLRPEHFVIRRNGVDADEHAEFDWERMQVSVGGTAPQALIPGAQDLLSFNFHLGFMADPRVARTLAIATGRKYGQYRLEVVADETLELPFGAVRTLHLRAPGANMTELWLAYDYLLLPVKIRHEDSKGGSLVQVATEIRLGRPRQE